jgi:hypothetical protein
MTTDSSCEPSQNVIPTEDLKGPSGGIYGSALRKAKTPLSTDPSAHSQGSLARDDSWAGHRDRKLALGWRASRVGIAKASPASTAAGRGGVAARNARQQRDRDWMEH